MVDAQRRRPAFTKRKKFGAGAKSDKFVIQDIVGAGEINQQVVRDPIQRARIEIAHCVLGNTLRIIKWTPRICRVACTVGGGIEIDIRIIGKKAIRPFTQKLIANARRIWSAKIEIQTAVQDWPGITYSKRQSSLADIPGTGINSAIKSNI